MTDIERIHDMLRRGVPIGTEDAITYAQHHTKASCWRIAEIEALLAEADRLVVWETAMPNGNEFQRRVEQALSKSKKG